MTQKPHHVSVSVFIILMPKKKVLLQKTGEFNPERDWSRRRYTGVLRPSVMTCTRRGESPIQAAFRALEKARVKNIGFADILHVHSSTKGDAMFFSAQVRPEDLHKMVLPGNSGGIIPLSQEDIPSIREARRGDREGVAPGEKVMFEGERKVVLAIFGIKS